MKRDFRKISPEFLRKLTSIAFVFLVFVFAVIFFEIYVPLNIISHETITYTVKKGFSDAQIAKDLQKMGIIRSNFFFRFYVLVSLQHSRLQAGVYSFSPRMSTYDIAKKIANGDAIKENLVIMEGWDIRDIGKYLEAKNICSQKDFVKTAGKDYSWQFSFLKDKPKNTSLEGYLFPDTYQISGTESCDEVVLMLLENFDKKLTPDLRAQITKDPKGTPKSIFDIITMASLLEKEVKTLNDKKIVSGILWKRISAGMPLQLDSTVNYITDGNDPSVSIKDTKINSPYNTYMYKGLPKGPISNPGLDSIIAALNPIKTNYWYYLSDGKTIFSQTFEQHDAAKSEYLQ